MIQREVRHFLPSGPAAILVRHAAISELHPRQHTNFYGLAASAAPNSSSMVEASGYKFSEKDMKPGKIKVKRQTKAKQKKAEGRLLLIHRLLEARVGLD